jgi:hypothetical protein
MSLAGNTGPATCSEPLTEGMHQATGTLRVETRGRGLVEITPEVAAWAAGEGIGTGLLTLFCRHTSASLLIQENAAPEVRRDLEAFFERIAPKILAATPMTTKGTTTCRPTSAPRSQPCRSPFR